MSNLNGKEVQCDFVELLTKCRQFDKMPIKSRTAMLNFLHSVAGENSVYDWIERKMRGNEMDMLTLYAISADNSTAETIAQLLCIDKGNYFHPQKDWRLLVNVVHKMNNKNIDECFANTENLLKRHKIEKFGWVKNWINFILAAHQEKVNLDLNLFINY